jgi:thiamine biosynthesis lipoprotein
MGTPVTLETRARDRDVGLARLESFLRILEETESQLSTWSETSLLIDVGRWVAETGGAFDPAIGALIEVWGLRTTPGVPAPEPLENARRRSGFPGLRIDPVACDATRLVDVILDAGAFGKGEALDRVAASREGMTASWMIDMGGQVMVHAGQEGASWSLELGHPRLRELPVARVELTSGSLATSGGSERDTESETGERIGHILDPRSGRTVSRSESVVVWHSSALAADILSTALYVMGPEEGFVWAARRDLSVAFLIPEADFPEADFTTAGDVRVLATPAFTSRFPELAATRSFR